MVTTPPGAEAAAGRTPGRGRRVILWRHGQTLWNVERRFQGTTDVPLTETGVAQARRSARLLASLKPDAIVASDLRRA
ncbi:histidine phosphatase family protein, partial [Streptomyces sp. NPDC057052]|uniref:histidine phosphatase family protein n=1 Tax=Streptomyces sp. NPDC057052 TaxID=3346010 RepID=UPI00363BE8CD